MKKIILILFGVAMFAAVSVAEVSKEFDFAWNVLDSLRLCQNATEYMDLNQNSADHAGMSDNLREANGQFYLAGMKLKANMEDDDELIRKISLGIGTGMAAIMEGNALRIDALAAVTDSGTKKTEQPEISKTEIIAEQKRAMRLIAQSASYLMYVIEDLSETEDPSGTIKFKISQVERDRLLLRIDELFKSKLEQYRGRNRMAPDGKKISSTDGNWLIATVLYLRDGIIADTYKEAKELEKKNQQ